MNRPVVLIHGSPGKPSAWKGVIKALGEDVTAITPSLPDHNQTYPHTAFVHGWWVTLAPSSPPP